MIENCPCYGNYVRAKSYNCILRQKRKEWWTRRKSFDWSLGYDEIVMKS